MLICCFFSCTHKESSGVNESVPDEEFIENKYPDFSELNLIPRSTDALTGIEIINYIRDLPLDQREDFILEEVHKGNVPNFLRKLVKITARTIINGNYTYITYYALPDYLALGSEDDYFLCPLTPSIAQKIAIELDCFLPTKKMVDQIWDAAKVKMNPQPIPPSNEMTTVEIFQQHHIMVWNQRKTFLEMYNLGHLVSGHKKDVVISRLIYENPNKKPVIIYGWHHKNGKIIQPLYAGHHENYVDYSHGIRLIQNKVYVDDVEMLANEVLQSEELKGLWSDEGVLIIPYYPS